MYTLGIDIGSTASKAVALKDGKELIGHTVESLGTGTEGPKLALKNLFDQTQRLCAFPRRESSSPFR